MILKVLDKNDSWPDILDKLDEETKEAREAMNVVYMMLASMPNICECMVVESKEELASELLDVIQVCVGGLDKLHDERINIKKAVARHNKKLEQRGWQYKCGINLTHRRLSMKLRQDPQMEEK